MTKTASQRFALDPDGVVRIRMPVADDIVAAAENYLRLRRQEVSRATILQTLAGWAISGQRIESCRVMYELGLAKGRAEQEAKP